MLWRRVSTGEQGESGLGLSGQLTIAKMFMGRDPIEIFTDVFSGKVLPAAEIEVPYHGYALLKIEKVD